MRAVRRYILARSLPTVKRAVLFAFVGVACLGLAAPFEAQQRAISVASAEGSVAHQRVACHGASAVPMTFDAEQSLPLKLVANLTCGQEVAVLSDLEGYTVHVSTANGLSGYVARAYLAPDAKSAPPAPQPATVQGR